MDACVRKMNTPQKERRPVDNSKFESRQIIVGNMVYSNEEIEVDHDEAKAEFDKFVAYRVEGKREGAGPLEGPTLRALFLCTRND
jgi:hypothetical protein